MVDSDGYARQRQSAYFPDLMLPTVSVNYSCFFDAASVQMGVDEKLVILADEVYQANIWKKGASFSSFKKVRYTQSRTRSHSCEGTDVSGAVFAGPYTVSCTMFHDVIST